MKYDETHQQLDVYITVELFDRLCKSVLRLGITKRELVTQALLKYLRSQDRKERREYRDNLDL